MKDNYIFFKTKTNINRFKRLFLTLTILLSFNSYAQYYSQHYVAPAPWRYFSDANELVVATESSTAVSAVVKRSDGTIITTLSVIRGTPAVYRFLGSPTAVGLEYYTTNTAISAAGLNITATAPVSINIRNVASDAFNRDATHIKGNASLTSFGDAGVGVRFRVGYYRDTDLGNFGGFGFRRPIYSVMAINNNTSLSINGVITVTLNAGQSYLFEATMGSLVETSGPAVVNTGARIDTPAGCGDGTLDQVPPISVLVREYVIYRGEGNSTAEQTTVIATEPNTVLSIQQFSPTGVLTTTIPVTLTLAGSFYTFNHGNGNPFSASRILSDKNIAVFSGTARGCEVDITSVAPVSACGGSNYVETYKFRNYASGDLPYFGYVITQSATALITLNGVNIESSSGVRRQLGSTGWYLIDFTNVEIGSPANITIESTSKMTVGIVQQGGGFSMAAIYSSYTQLPDPPTFVPATLGGGCTSAATLNTNTGFGPYQWFLNGTAISGANSNTYTTTITGNYSVSSTLTCGSVVQSLPISITICSDVSVSKKVNIDTPCTLTNVIFTVTAMNNGPSNATGVLVRDLLPSGYAFVSSNASLGTYNVTSGDWSIGSLVNQQSAVLTITARVKTSGVYQNTATITASSDSDSSNNSASATTTPNPTPAAPIANSQVVCADGNANQTLTATATGGPGETITWYTDETGGTVVTSPTQTGVGSTTFYAQSSNGTCSSLTRTAVTLTINAAPNAPTANSQTVCTDGTANQTLTATATYGPGETITWYTDATGTTIVTSPTQTGVGSTTFYAESFNGTCCSVTRTPVTVTINAAPAAPLADDQKVCANGNASQTLTATATGGTITWYTDATDGTVVTSPTQTGVGSSTYFAESSNVTCSSLTRTPVCLTINAAPAAPTATNQTVCTDGTTTQTLTATATGGTITWYTAATAGTVVTSPTQVGVGSITYFAESSNGTCSSLTRTAVILTINASIIASAVIVNNNNCVGCNNGKISQTVSGGTMPYTYIWSNGATSKDITNLVSGTYTVEIKDFNGCTANYSYSITESGVSLVKTGAFSDSNNDGFAQVGEKINYRFIITNTGNVNLSSIILTDPMIGLVLANNNTANLPVGQSVTVTGIYTLTQVDVDAGRVTNTALASGKDLDGNDVTDISGTASNNNTSTITTLVQQGNITISKDGIYVDSNNDGVTNIGDKIAYTFVVTNTGNVTLTNVTVSDPLPGLVLTGSSITLNIGTSNATQFIGSYSLTQADINAGAVYNIATVTGTLPSGAKVTATSTDPTPCTSCSQKPNCINCTITVLNKSPQLEVIKTSLTTAYSLLGDVITYTITVKNSGNVTLFQIIVTDPLTGLNTTIASLLPGETQNFTEDYIIRKIDLETNTVTNTAFATGVTIENIAVNASDTLITAESLVLGCGTIIVHNAFSPNGDGINDVFSVDNISDTICYPDNSIEIYNRWGVLVFETKNYNNQSNNFEGISRGRTTIAQSSGLPAGTYFYVLNYSSVDGNGDLQNNQKDGYIYLTK